MIHRRSKLLELARRAKGLFPLTVRGLLVASVGFWFFRSFGLSRLDLVALVFGVGSLSLTAVSILAAVGATLWLRRRGVEPPSHLELEAGVPAKTGFVLPGLRFVPLLHVEWTWVEPRVDRCDSRPRSGTLEEEITPAHRGEARAISRRFGVGDVFGLVRLEWNEVIERRVVILPSVGGLRKSPVVRALAEGQELPVQHGSLDGDRMDIRRYVPGDSIRHILWRSFALTRQLDVRVPEPSAAPSRRMVAYLICGELDEAAAGMARLAIESGALGEGWIFGVDGDSTQFRRPRPALRAIAASATNRPDKPRSGLGSFLASATTAGGAAHVHCLVFAPAVSGPWLRDLSATMERFPQRISVVLVCDEMESLDRESLYQRIVYEKVENLRPNRQDVAVIFSALQPLTTDVALYSRMSGLRILDMDERPITLSQGSPSVPIRSNLTSG